MTSTSSSRSYTIGLSKHYQSYITRPDGVISKFATIA